MSDSLIERILLYRNGPDGVSGTFDDGVFMQASNLAAELAQRVKVSQEDINVLNQLVSKGQLGIDSKCFRIRSDGEAIKKRQVLEIDAVADIEGKILSWSAGMPRRMTPLELEQAVHKTETGD